jgi:hypothetical protein
VIFLKTFNIQDYSALNDEGLMYKELEMDVERTVLA